MYRRCFKRYLPVRIGPRRRQTFPDAPLANRGARFCAPDEAGDILPSPWDAESPLEPSIARPFTGSLRDACDR